MNFSEVREEIINIQNAIKQSLKVSDIEIYFLTKDKKKYSFDNEENVIYGLFQICYGIKIIVHNPQEKNLVYKEIARFSLQELPGCCGVCLLHGIMVQPFYRNRKIGSVLAKLQKFLSIIGGYSVLFCTDISSNLPQKKILNKNDYKDIYRFNNLRTKNYVDFSVCSLREDIPGKALNGVSPKALKVSLNKKNIFNKIYDWLFL